MKLHILVVDDEPRIRKALEDILEDEGYQVSSAGSGEECVRQVAASSYDLLFLDVILPGMNGLDTLKKVREISPRSYVIMMSGQADLSTAVQATKLGAHNFLEKPLNPERVLIELVQIARQVSLEARVDALESMMDEGRELVGESPPMRRLKEIIQKSAPSDGRILILGENGTGKELVARAIHEQSLRKTAPFICLNCAAIPANLVESELFGYEKGAFTGAEKNKPGRFEIADGGTLFLDEVADMNLDTQAKLLRVLQENEAMRLGGDDPYSFDVRVISATNKDLKQAILEGRFREDLYYRLNVIPVQVPPLRDRSVDIPLLAQHFLKQYCRRTGSKKSWGEGCLSLLEAYTWPGNVRELLNFTERLGILSRSDVVSEDDVKDALPKQSLNPVPESVPDQWGTSLRQQIEAFEKHVLMQTFSESDGNVSEMSRRLKVDRANLHRRLKAFGIK